MGQTYTNLIIHVIFSTKDRIEVIDPEMKPKLFAYMSGIIRNIKGKPLKINGISDHVHLLIQLSPTNSISQAVQTIKANSSRWIHENYPSKESFAWQTGYGAFSVSRSSVPIVFKYIENQEMHHQKLSFKDEFLTLLKKNDIEYDENFIWQ
ncbi:MAG: IS200/IS605 family transposase [Acidobacteria bacterium]|nr:IS200/IS605 family transposase [Acidobacteriota bacterium]